MTITEFPIDIEGENEGLGTLFISDARVLIRPAVHGQYPASVKHDSAHAYRILRLGNDMGVPTTHIIFSGNPETACQMLDRVFYAYVDAECISLWCDARVSYIVDGKIVKETEHGFTDGTYTMHFKVYCNVIEDETEVFLARLIETSADTKHVVVRPDSSESGYTLHGFVTELAAYDYPDNMSEERCDGCIHWFETNLLNEDRLCAECADMRQSDLLTEAMMDLEDRLRV